MGESYLERVWECCPEWEYENCGHPVNEDRVRLSRQEAIDRGESELDSHDQWTVAEVVDALLGADHE
jgi:hypothetical protein